MDTMWLLLGLGYLMRPKTETTHKDASAPVPPKPTVYAYLYQLPDDGFTTTRMAFGEFGKEPEEMGIFQDPEHAKRVAISKGWHLAWDGVRQLQARPGG